MTCKARLKPYSRIDRGFTLIEVLVSLTIMALIMAVAFSGLSVGIDSWERGSKKIEELENRFALERLVQRQVALAYSQPFRGTDGELEFVTRYSLANGPGDLIKVKYSADSEKLLYTETPLAVYTPEGSNNALTRTLGRFPQIHFRYFGTVPNRPAAWVNEWTQKMGLPSAVRIQIGNDALTIPLVNGK